MRYPVRTVYPLRHMRPGQCGTRGCCRNVAVSLHRGSYTAALTDSPEINETNNLHWRFVANFCNRRMELRKCCILGWPVDLVLETDLCIFEAEHVEDCDEPVPGGVSSRVDDGRAAGRPLHVSVHTRVRRCV